MHYIQQMLYYVLHLRFHPWKPDSVDAVRNVYF